MKRLFEPLSTGWVSVVTHKMRSCLTILGVVIGVAAVIILMSVGKGTTSRIVSNLSNLGTNLVYISPGSTSSGKAKDPPLEGGIKTFKEDIISHDKP